MAYASVDARQELLDGLAAAIDDVGYALATLGSAYEQLDEYSADKLEQALFRPSQTAFARAKRTYAEFAGRHGLTTRGFEAQAAGLPSTGAKGFIDAAVEAVGEADQALATLQDAPSFVDVGDLQLRAGLADVRKLLGGIRIDARDLVRRLGR
ncbi:MAG: hypothetical protein WD993_04485 [Thermoleophilaceae bacterium]